MVSTWLTSLVRVNLWLWICLCSELFRGAAAQAVIQASAALQLSNSNSPDDLGKHLFWQPQDHAQAWGQQRASAAATWTQPWTHAGSLQPQSPSMQPGQSHRRQLMQSQQAAGLPDSSNPAMAQWLQDSRQYSERFAKGSCFPDYPGFIAKDITDFVRLIKDPAATHIELKGDIVFTNEIFPPENANDQSKGINVTHKVQIRACTSAEEPVIVDINNALQQIYVSGSMIWQGSIKFINTFPSPRRGGMFALISVLSVEGDGVVEFRGLQIHGNEPSPLFNEADPYWYVYANDTKFVPMPGDYAMIDSNNLVMHNWTFNKTAWVLRSQGTKGVVRAEGNAVWRWVDVLISWSPPAPTGSGGLSGSALALAIALPVVFGVLLLAACGVGAVWLRRRRRQRKALEGSHVDEDKFVQVVPSGPSKASTTGGAPPSSFNGGGSNGELGPMELSTAFSNTSMATAQLIEQARRRMQETSSTKEASIVLESLLGEGTFGKVYSAMWKGTLVAVKTMLLPAAMSGKERREKMAIMETAISSSLSHPNIVQTYTYEVRPLTGELARKALERKAPVNAGASIGSAFTFLEDTDNTSDHHGWELRLVLEMADLGNLKEFLGRGGFKLADGQRDMAAIVATALDIARAMLHLHTENIIHSDLKARNVLLKSAGGDARGFVAKVSDFGLSMRIDPSETHVSNFYQGTLTHMAPEVLMYGKISFASDVYAYGIILWEMYTAMQAFKGVPRALLGHEVTKMGRRPEFPPDCPFDYQLLACRCWESDPAIRPTFAQILADLERMGSKLQGRRMDSASSLPLQGNGAVRRPSYSTPGAGDAAAHMGYPAHAAGVTAGTSLVAAAAAGGLAGRQFGSPENDEIDPAKYHNWEPQTSLLELGSTMRDTASKESDTGLSMGQQHPQLLHHQQQQRGGHAAAAQGGALVPHAGSPACSAAGMLSAAAASNANINSHQLGVVSLGSWDAPSGGLWMSGSLAPIHAPGIVRPAQAQAQPWVGPQAAANGHPMVQQGVAAAAGPSTPQVQQQGWEQGQAALQAAHMREHPHPSLQQYVLLRQQQYANQHPQQQYANQHLQQQQQQQQAQLRPQQQQQQQGAAGAYTSNDASSSGVYLDHSSSLVMEGSTGGSGCSGATGSSDAYRTGTGKPNGSSIAAVAVQGAQQQ